MRRGESRGFGDAVVAKLQKDERDAVRGLEFRCAPYREGWLAGRRLVQKTAPGSLLLPAQPSSCTVTLEITKLQKGTKPLGQFYSGSLEDCYQNLETNKGLLLNCL